MRVLAGREDDQSVAAYGPSGTEVWTVYTHDYMGRTLSVTLPDGASATKYTYQGNWTTVVDPAGKWNQYQSDVFGNVVNVVEPDPLATNVLTTAPNTPSTSGTGILVTTYMYDSLNHLINVSMPRGSVTQTRTFVYDPVTLRLTSMTSPETGTSSSTGGTTSFTYNADGTVATRTDRKSQVTTYTTTPTRDRPRLRMARTGRRPMRAKLTITLTTLGRTEWEGSREYRGVLWCRAVRLRLRQ